MAPGKSTSVRAASAAMALLSLGASAAPAPAPLSTAARSSGGVGVLDVFIPSIRNDDQYYNVNLTFNGQVVPVMLDTGSGDVFVASNECPTDDPSEGCYGLQQSYVIQPSDNVLNNETFFTTVGEGSVYGNQSLLDVDFGGVSTSPDPLAVGLVYESALNEFQGGSFAGILGLNMRGVSRQLYFNGREPPLDALVGAGRLAEPKFSLSLPRLGDPDSGAVGRLTLGGIGEEFAGLDLTYGPVFKTPNYNYDDYPLDYQGWTVQLEGIRVNGHEVNMTEGLLLETGEYVAMLDSGSQAMRFRDDELEQIVSLLNGETIYETSGDVFFECAVPQLVELKYFGAWFPVDPLDLIIPSDHGRVNGTEMCHAALGLWRRTFGDAIIGVPFLRSAHAVFDYATTDLAQPQPRVGLVSTVDAARAVARYPDLYKARLL